MWASRSLTLTRRFILSRHSIPSLSSCLPRFQHYSTQTPSSPLSDLIANAMKDAQSIISSSNTPSTSSSLDLAPKHTPREWTFKTASIDTSPKKAMLVVKLLKHLSARQALEQMEFNKRKTAIYVKRMIHRALASIQHNTMYAINEKKAQVQYPPITSDHLEIVKVIVNKGLYKKGIKYHAKGRFGVMHHPSCRVKVTFREVLDEEIVEGFQGRSFGRKKTEFEKLVNAFRKDKSRRRCVRATTPLRVTEPVWSKKNWKYVTSNKWLNPEQAYPKNKRPSV